MMFGSSSTIRMRAAIATASTVGARTDPGTAIENLAPASATFSAQIRPPAADSSPRVIERPMPVPNDACARRSAAIEALEQMLELARIEAGPAIGHRDVQAVPFDLGLHENLAVLRRVVRGVLEHVRQRHRCQPWIDLHLHLGVRIHAQRVPVERMPDVRHRGVDDVGGGDPLPLDADRLGVDARHVEDVLEQPGQPIELRHRGARLRTPLLGREIRRGGSRPRR